MEYLPLFHNLKGRTVLIVGGGEIALRKARLLSDAGARLRVVAPSIEAQLVELVQAGAGECLDRGYARQDLQGCVLAIAATDDEPLNATVSQHANALGVPVNVVDSPQLCSVIFPAIVDRSPLVVAVSDPCAHRDLDPGSLRSAGRAGKTVSCPGQGKVRQRAATAGVLGGGVSGAYRRTGAGRADRRGRTAAGREACRRGA